MDLASLWQAWPIAGPWHLAPLSGGTNNQVWCAQTADGKRYALRLVPDLTQQARLRSESALLSALSYEGLLRRDATAPDPLTAVERLPISRANFWQLQSMLAEGAEKGEDLYGHLPQQLLHRDYDPSNILMEDQRVTAVLDFEFAGIDLRVMDLCVALLWWPFNLMGTGKEWAVIDAFAGAYAKGLHLSEEERYAIPDVLRLREAGGLIHHMKCYFAGRETDARIKAQVEHTLWRETWLLTHGKTLRKHAMTWR